MEAKAKLYNIRATQRKIGVIADELRGKPVNEAFNYLMSSPRKRIAGYLQKVIKSAVANADQTGKVDVDNLFIKELLVAKGAHLKRFMTRAKGSASPILKKTSHIYVTVAEK